jgi:hypothetical protein
MIKQNLTKNEFKNLYRLVKYAEVHNPNNRVHFAAGKYKKKFIIVENSYNELLNDLIIKKHYTRYFPHAEYTLFRAINFDKIKTVYIIRLSSLNNHFLNSKPCINCRNFMVKMGVRYVIYSTEDGIRKIKL